MEPPPPGKLADEYGIELSSLRQIERTVTSSPIGSGPGSCLLEYADHVIAATLCKRGELGHLS